MINELFRISAIQEKINLDKVFGSGGVDITENVDIVLVGATGNITGATHAQLATPITGVTNPIDATGVTYTVPAGKKAIPVSLISRRIAITTDDDITYEVTETATVKFDEISFSGQQEVKKEHPFTTHEFAAAAVVKLYAKTAGAAKDVDVEMLLVLLVVPA